MIRKIVIRVIFGCAVGVLAAREAGAALTSGLMLTNFATASFNLPGGAAVDVPDAGINPVGVPNSQTCWILVTDSPQLCLKLWKQATNAIGTPLTPVGVPLLPEVYPQTDFVCFTVSFSNCGGYSAVSLTITDVMPVNTVRGAAIAGSTYIQGGGPAPQAYWANSLAGPWLQTPVQGQVGPLYLRWSIARIGMYKTGYIRYCLTVL